MKHFNYFAAMLICISFTLLGYACSDEDKTNAEITVSKESLAFAKEAASQTMYIKSNMPWQIQSSELWCTVSPQSGGEGTTKIEVTVTANTNSDMRMAVLTVKSGNVTKEIRIEQDKTDLLIVKKTVYDVAVAGEQITVELQLSDAHRTTINVDWITKPTSKAVSNVTETFVVTGNTSMVPREGTITFEVGMLTETITIRQSGVALNIPADKMGMATDALLLAPKMGIGWNLGNSLEACSITSASETMWGNTKTAKLLIDAVKKAGFNTVRIPCAWSGYLENETDYKIKDWWLARVKEVVDYCVDNDMYAIVNIHWDGGWLEENPTYAKQTEVNKKQKALWEQISVYFRDYDEHLLFAGTNEVHASGDPTAENIAVQLSFNQTFVDAVRSTGGKNTWRNLIVQSFNTNIDQAISYLKMPTDATANRLMAEVHYYDPWDFCGLEKDESWGTMKYFWGKEGGYDKYGQLSDWGQEDWVRTQFGKMKSNFGDKGIPVILGEYGAILRTIQDQAKQAAHIESRNYYFNYVTKSALTNGIVPVYWDNGGNFGLFNRSTGAQLYPQTIQAIIDAAKK